MTEIWLGKIAPYVFNHCNFDFFSKDFNYQMAKIVDKSRGVIKEPSLPNQG